MKDRIHRTISSITCPSKSDLNFISFWLDIVLLSLSVEFAGYVKNISFFTLLLDKYYYLTKKTPMTFDAGTSMLGKVLGVLISVFKYVYNILLCKFLK